MNKPFVFVLMPFAKEYNKIYNNAIKAACESREIEMYCERVDKQIFEERILDRIYNQINKADYIIADLSGKNANVFYEVGYAHALNKKVILLINDTKDIPFDLKHHPHIVYGNKIQLLKNGLISKLKWYKANPNRKSEPNFEAIKFYVDGQKVEKDRQIQPECKFNFTGSELHFDLDIQNQSESIFSENGEVWLEVISSEFKKGERDVLLPDNSSGVQYFGGTLKKILPKCWDKVVFNLFAKNPIRELLVHVNLKVYTDLSPISIPFVIKLKYSPIGLKIV